MKAAALAAAIKAAGAAEMEPGAGVSTRGSKRSNAKAPKAPKAPKAASKAAEAAAKTPADVAKSVPVCTYLQVLFYI